MVLLLNDKKDANNTDRPPDGSENRVYLRLIIQSDRKFFFEHNTAMFELNLKNIISGFKITQ